MSKAKIATKRSGAKPPKREPASSRGKAAKGRAVTPERARTRAEKVLRDPKKIKKVADEAEAFSKKSRSSGIRKLKTDLGALVRLIRAYQKKEYRAIGWDSLVLIVAALIYLVSPIDLVPDALPGGLIDDAAVLGWTLALVSDELDDFKAWEAATLEA